MLLFPIIISAQSLEIKTKVIPSITNHIIDTIQIKIINNQTQTINNVYVNLDVFECLNVFNCTLKTHYVGGVGIKVLGPIEQGTKEVYKVPYIERTKLTNFVDMIPKYVIITYNDGTQIIKEIKSTKK